MLRQKKWLLSLILLALILTGSLVAYAAKPVISLNSPVSFPVDI